MNIIDSIRSVGARIKTRFAAARRSCERGAITAEYTLVTLVGATVALLLMNWAKGGALADFFQKIFDKVVALFSCWTRLGRGALRAPRPANQDGPEVGCHIYGIESMVPWT